MKIYGIYDIQNNEQCLRIGSLEEIIKFLNLTIKEIGLALRKNSTIRNKYKIYFLFTEEVQKIEKRTANRTI